MGLSSNDASMVKNDVTTCGFTSVWAVLPAGSKELVNR
jgi:hypothetical protein